MAYPCLLGGGRSVRAQWLASKAGSAPAEGGILVLSDISCQRQVEALSGQLKGGHPFGELAARSELESHFEQALARARAQGQRLALAWLNLDGFRHVNEALGHPAGDQLLRCVAGRLRASLRAGDLVAHMGGDDFLILVAQVASRRHLRSLAARLNRLFAQAFPLAGEAVYLTASCGFALYPGGGETVAALQEGARSAMRAVKARGGNGFAFYSAAPGQAHGERLKLARQIREGIASGQFTLHYQPLVALEGLRTVAIEALARWQHPERGLVRADQFIPFAEESGLIVELGRHLLGQACRQLGAWQKLIGRVPRLALNVSARQIQRSDVCAQVQRAAAEAGIECRLLEVEITETAVLQDPERAAKVVACLRRSGVRVALDDFGTGYSSLTHLHQLAIDRVKIDRSFVASCADDSTSAAIVESVTELAHRLGLEVAAEGVEREEQLRFLRQVGCDVAQGHLLSPPLPAEDCERYLARRSGS